MYPCALIQSFTNSAHSLDRGSLLATSSAEFIPHLVPAVKVFLGQLKELDAEVVNHYLLCYGVLLHHLLVA